MSLILQDAHLELSEYLNNILPENYPDEETEKLVDYLIQVVKKESKTLLANYMLYDKINHQQSNNINPQSLINLYILPNSFPPQPNYSYYQPIPNQMPFNTSPSPLPQQQPMFIYPNFMTNNPVLPNILPIQEGKKHNHKNHNHHKPDKSRKKPKDKKKDKSSKKNKRTNQSKHKSDKAKKFTYQQGKDFNGIMKYLIDKTGGNICENGTIEIKTNSLNPPYLTKYLVDYKSDEHYCTNYSEPNAYVCFDFKEKSIKLTSYSIQSFYENNCLKNWVLEVSKNESDWIEVDRHSNDGSIHGQFITATFNLNTTDFYRFIRLRQTGKNWINDYCTNINKIEFYGELME